MNPIYTYVAVAFLLVLICEMVVSEMVVDDEQRPRYFKKAIIKHNKIAHFFGKRGGALMDAFPLSEFQGENEGRLSDPYQNEAGGYPVFMNRPFVDSNGDAYPIRRDDEEQIPVSHIFGRHLPYIGGRRKLSPLDIESIIDGDLIADDDDGSNSVLQHVLLRTRPEQREQLLEYIDSLIKSDLDDIVDK